MRDYEELVERLRICPDYNDGCKNCPHEHDLGCRSTTMREAANAIEKLASNADKFKWISVEDALPKEERKTYLVYTNDGSQHECRWTNNRFGIGESDKWGWSIFDIPQYTVVTHWMPLPEPPKEGTSDD